MNEKFSKCKRGILLGAAFAFLLGPCVPAQQAPAPPPPRTPRTPPRPVGEPTGPVVVSDETPGLDIKAKETPAAIPFDEWIEEKNVNAIPWSIGILPPRLSLLQRIFVAFRISISPKSLRLLGPGAKLFFAVRLRPAGGAWPEDGIHAGVTPLEKIPKDAAIEFTCGAFIRPGEYTAGLIVYEARSGRRSAATRPLRVPPIPRDPLPEIDKNFPTVEFSRDAFAVKSDARRERLYLPVATRRPVRIELLVNFSPSMEFQGVKRAHEGNVASMLGLLKVLSEMELTNGTLHVTALDLLHRSVVFEQEIGRELDMARLNAALAEMNPLRVSVEDLEERRRTAAFFRGVLQSRLQPPGERAARGAARSGRSSELPAEPLRVIVVLSSPLLFHAQSDLEPLPAIEGCDCRIYHLQYRVSPWNLWDQLHRTLREYQPTRMQIESPAEFRRALARILNELRAL